jgi:hypothetical protein
MTAANVETVLALRRRYWENGFRPIEVWNPDQPVNDKGEPLSSPGKQPRGRWRDDAGRNPPAAVERRPDARALNTGVMCGEIVGVDVDILDQELADQIVNMIEAMIGPTPLVRIGRPPKTLLVYRVERQFAKVQTPELLFPDDTKAKVELLAEGQQFVADGIHPDTALPYSWTDRSPAEMRLCDLPLITKEQARAIITEAERLLRAAGGREKEKPRAERHKANGAAGDFFSEVNAAALGDIGAWARLLFPRARFEPGTGAWRVSSKDLGRNLEEDISIHPDGVRDFGEETPLSAIDLVMRHGGCATALDAAQWLGDRLGINKPKAATAHAHTTGNSHDNSRGNPWTIPPTEYVCEKLSLTGWLTRDIKPPDYLMGELLSTTSRVELVAPTGLGKTNLALALAAATADGRDFLHWRGSGKPSRVLFIDGEMPERLMHSRVKDAVRRLGSEPGTLYVLSRENFPDTPPLNTKEGQKFIEMVIESIGGVDLVVFDNIQSLCTGIMKEEESWKPVLPWIRELTRRKIGQIWIHHTGLNEDHGYGTSTREWQLDTVILLERVEQPGADIAFQLTFTKTRERTPNNRTDFEPALITLADDTWTSERGGHVRTRSRTTPDRAVELLQEAIIRDGTIPPANEHIPPNTPCVTEGLWRRYCEAGFLTDGSPEPAKKAEAVRKAFKRACEKLIGTRVGKWDLWVWIIRT